MTKERFTADKVIAALKNSKGWPDLAADELRCDRRTIYRKIEQYPSVKTVFEDLRERRKDRAERTFVKLLDEGNVTALIFYLKTQAKDRGYVERQEVQLDGAVMVDLNEKD